MKLLAENHPLKASNSGAQLCFYLILWYILSAVLTGFFGFPKLIVYVGDIINIWLFMKAIIFQRGKLFKRDFVLFAILLFSVVALFSGIANIKSLWLFLWGIRQNFRYFIFYYSCTVFLHWNDYDILFKLVNLIFWISLPLCIYEALLVSYPAGVIVGDYVGGIYYGIQGVNAPLNIILLIHCTNYLIDYFDKRHSLIGLVSTLGAALAMSTLAELKVFLLEIVVISVLVMINNGVSIKSVVLILIGIVAVGIVVQAFVYVNGKGRSYYNTSYLSFSGLFENAFRSSGYDGNGDLNRFYSVQTLTRYFFSHDKLGYLFGLGLGNAEYSLGYDTLTSTFYKTYSYLHYQYFSVSFIFIESGIIGLINYFSIFILGLIQGIRYISNDSRNKIFYIIMCLSMILLIFYNPSLRNEQCAFILYLILSMPIVYLKSINDSKRTDLAAESKPLYGREK